MNTATQSVNQPEMVIEKVGKLSDNVRRLADAATFISFSGIFIGAGATFLFGPAAFAAGASVAFIVTFGVKFYAMAKKRKMTDEVLDLKSKQILSENEADTLKNKIREIYGEPPK